jgi:hypothetical protein
MCARSSGGADRDRLTAYQLPSYAPFEGIRPLLRRGPFASTAFADDHRYGITH